MLKDVTDGLVLVRFDADGMRCVVRDNGWGALCGYVELPSGHPWLMLDSDSIPTDVHGGCTYLHSSLPNEESTGTNWVGFDCGHCGDWTRLSPRGHKWTTDEVAEETRKLAREAFAALEGN